MRFSVQVLEQEGNGRNTPIEKRRGEKDAERWMRTVTSLSGAHSEERRGSSEGGKEKIKCRKSDGRKGDQVKQVRERKIAHLDEVQKPPPKQHNQKKQKKKGGSGSF